MNNNTLRFPMDISTVSPSSGFFDETVNDNPFYVVNTIEQPFQDDCTSELGVHLNRKPSCSQKLQKPQVKVEKRRLALKCRPGEVSLLVPVILSNKELRADSDYEDAENHSDSGISSDGSDHSMENEADKPDHNCNMSAYDLLLPLTGGQTSFARSHLEVTTEPVFGGTIKSIFSLIEGKSSIDCKITHRNSALSLMVNSVENSQSLVNETTQCRQSRSRRGPSIKLNLDKQDLTDLIKCEFIRRSGRLAQHGIH